MNDIFVIIITYRENGDLFILMSNRNTTKLIWTSAKYPHRAALTSLI